MCFSATASFTAAGVLAPIGVYSLVKAKPKERLLALMPLLFAIQQIIEGIQWLSIGQGATCQMAGYGFLFFAFILWPIYAPLASMSIEPDAARRATLQRLVPFGIVLALLLIGLTLMRSLSIQVYDKAIFYNIGWPASVLGVVAFLYACYTSLVFFLSSHFWVRLLGVVSLFSAAIAAYVYMVSFTSVWCFFEAVLSSIIAIYFYTRTSK
ncbi:MAG: DUF6629 family protein [Patescibacteria group bacterium]